MTTLSPHPSDLKIGIFSKPAHCKNHATALRKDGYEVIVLGGDPVDVPPTIDLLVVRTASISHGAFDAATAWARKTGKPRLVENGLSGIRRKLREMFPRSEEVRPGPANVLENSEVEVMASYPAFPNEDWVRAVSESRAKENYEAAIGVFRKLSPTYRKELSDALLTREPGDLSHIPVPDEITVCFGRPLLFFLVFLMCAPEGASISLRALQEAYAYYTEKKSDGRVVRAASWMTGRKIHYGSSGRKPSAALVEKTPEVLSAGEPSVSTLPVDPTADLRRELEGQMLDLLSSTVSDLRRETETMRGAFETRLREEREAFETRLREEREAFETRLREEREAAESAINALRRENEAAEAERFSQFQSAQDAWEKRLQTLGEEVFSAVEGSKSKASSDGFLDLLDALKARGASLSLSLP